MCPQHGDSCYRLPKNQDVGQLKPGKGGKQKNIQPGKPGRCAHSCNPSSPEAEARGSQMQGKFGLQKLAIRHATTSASPCRLWPWCDPTRPHPALTPVITGLRNNSSRLAFPKRSESLHRKCPGILCYHLLGIAFHLIRSFTPALFLTQEPPSILLYQEPLLTSDLALAIFSYKIKMGMKLYF